MNLYAYENYKAYVAAQRQGWMKKREKIWALRENIEVVADLLKAGNPAFGICHGARTGSEQKWFMEFLPSCKVIGTDIGDGENTVKWDFNKQNPDWIKSADFVYSNSFDHAYDLENAMRVWFAQLKPGGVLILEHSTQHGHDGSIGKKANKTDPIGICLDELLGCLRDWLQCEPETIPLPGQAKKSGQRYAVMVRK